MRLLAVHQLNINVNAVGERFILVSTTRGTVVMKSIKVINKNRDNKL